MGQVNLRDIAGRAGVSVATVSLALRGRGALSRATSDRIRSLAQEMGYRPNPLLASLAGKRFRSAKAVGGVPMAIFSFPSTPDGLDGRTNYAGKLLAAEARKLGYSPKVYNLTNGSDTPAVFRELYHRMTQGIIVCGSMGTEFFDGFDWSQFSVVQCGRYHKVHAFHIVRPNIFQAIKTAFMKLRASGYDRIGFALGRHLQPMEDDEERYGVAISIEKNYRPEKHRVPIYTGIIRDDKAFLDWFDRYKPEAVVGFAVRYYWNLKDRGISIPADTGFVGLHLDDPGSPGFYSGLFQDQGEIARQSVLLVDQMIRNRERGGSEKTLDILVPSKWVKGKTMRQKE